MRLTHIVVFVAFQHRKIKQEVNHSCPVMPDVITAFFVTREFFANNTHNAFILHKNMSPWNSCLFCRVILNGVWSETEGRSRAPAVLFNTSICSYYYLWESRASFMVWKQNGDHQLKLGPGITQLPFMQSGPLTFADVQAHMSEILAILTLFTSIWIISICHWRRLM